LKYVSFNQSGTSSWGILREGQIVDLPVAGAALDLSFPSRLLDFVQRGVSGQQQVARVVDAIQAGRQVPGLHHPGDIQLIAPIPRPAKNVFALGLNYAEHVAESHDAAPLPAAPIYFTKAVTAVIGPEAVCVADPELTSKLDWEVELGVVIGDGGRKIPKERALEHVFGYTVMIDLSARDLQSGRGGQWFLGKSLDGSCPMGPVLVTADEISDPQTLEISLKVNGVEKQHSNTRHMIFGVAQIIADLSRYVTLEAGDVITTGTPSGVGSARKPPEFLQPGDIVEAEIASIGVLRTRIGEPTG